MATQLMQPLPCKQEQQVSQAQQASVLCQFPAMAPRRWPMARRPSSPRSALYDVHHYHNNNNCSSEGLQLSHGLPSHATIAPSDGDASWEVRAFAEDSVSCTGQWPPRSYACSFCRREFRTAQALGGHMNVHRRERAQANNMAMLRSTAQQAATSAIAAATPQELIAVAGPQGSQWCLYSRVGVNTAAIASPEKRAFLCTPGGANIATTNSSGGSSHFTLRSSPGPSLSQYNKTGASNDNRRTSAMYPSAHFSSSSALSSTNSQGSLSSVSSAITSEGRGGTPYQIMNSVFGDSVSCAQKLQLGAFQPYQSNLFAHKITPLVTQELIELRHEHHNSTLFSKSMFIRGHADDVGFLDLELRLGPAG